MYEIRVNAERKIFRCKDGHQGQITAHIYVSTVFQLFLEQTVNLYESDRQLQWQQYVADVSTVIKDRSVLKCLQFSTRQLFYNWDQLVEIGKAR